MQKQNDSQKWGPPTKFEGNYDASTIKYFSGNVEVTIVCPHCGERMTFNAGDDHFEYPTTDVWLENETSCWECEREFPYKVKITMPVIIEIQQQVE